MWSIISTVLSIGLEIFGFIKAKKEAKAKHAKKILDQFKKVSNEGDTLFDELSKEMNRRSDVNWDDINVRGKEGP